MVKTWFSILCVSVVLVVAGCGVPRGEYVALDTKYTQALAENKTANKKILELNERLLKAKSTLKQLTSEKESLARERDALKADIQTARDDAAKSRQAASQALAELKTAQASIKIMEAHEARLNAQMAQVKAIAEQIQIDLKSLLKWLNSDTMAADPPLNGNGRATANTVGHDSTGE